MKKLIAIILLLCMLTSLVACKKAKENNTDTPDSSITDPGSTEPPADPVPTIVVPEYKDYGRGSVDFSKIIYSRPNVQALISSFNSVKDTVKGNSKSIAEQISDIRALEQSLSNVKTMYSLVEINQSKNSSASYWNTEAGYFGIYYPELTQAVEDLLVACAQSEHKEAFETDYFGYSLDEYADGGIYTDAVVLLMQREAELENEYSSLSTATVEISYTRFGVAEPFVGTVDEVKDQLKEYFGNDTAGYNNVLPYIDTLYNQKLKQIVPPIYVELLKVRRSIANELGYKDYTELAYKTLGYDYSPEEILALYESVAEYVFAVTDALTLEIFNGYEPPKVSIDRVTLINTLYSVYSKMGGDYSDAFSYMLQHGLYDVSAKSENRYNGAFTAYLDGNASPYLFVTTSGLMSDYTIMAHEFGHFLDGYVNYGQEDSLAVMEISSQALELLTLLKLSGTLHTPEYRYLKYVTMSSYLYDVLLAQSFYSVFEHMAYSLSDEDITLENLTALVKEAHTFIYGESSMSLQLSDVLIPHTVLYPCYVESYVTSALVSLDIFFAEAGESGSGLALYEALLDRDELGLSFAERLEEAGIDSPFSEGKVMETANSIYYYLTGKNYDFGGETENAA